MATPPQRIPEGPPRKAPQPWWTLHSLGLYISICLVGVYGGYHCPCPGAFEFQVWFTHEVTFSGPRQMCFLRKGVLGTEFPDLLDQDVQEDAETV